MTSSKTRTTPWRAVTARSPARNSGVPGIEPAEPCTGSTMTAASSSAWAAMRSSAARWLNGSTIVFATVSSGMPGDSTVATGASTGPASPGLYWTLIITVS